MKIKNIKKIVGSIKSLKNNLKIRAPYIEIHLCDHCNLNCKGCGHFCPIVDKEIFTDLEQFKKDIKELSKKILFDEIRLMGGEPLLHKEINEFICATRHTYPNSEIRIVTNGILLSTMDIFFWKTVRNNRVIIDLSKYPAVGNEFSEYLDLINDNNATLGRINLSKKFLTTVNFKGDSNIKKTHEKCHSKHCVTLWNSKLYPCPICYRKYANEFFDENLLIYQGLDIYKMSGREMLSKFYKPIEHCKYCEMINPEKFEWTHSEKEKSEWGRI